jgi:Ras family
VENIPADRYTEMIIPVVGITGCGKSKIVRRAISAFNGAIFTSAAAQTEMCHAFAIVEQVQYHLLCVSGSTEIDEQQALFKGANRAIFVFDTEPRLYEKQSAWWNKFKNKMPAHSWYFILNKSDIYQVRDNRTFLASYDAFTERPSLQISAVSARAPARIKTFFTDYVFKQQRENV